MLLFVLVSPRLLLQISGRNRAIDFQKIWMSGVSILVRTIIFFILVTIFLELRVEENECIYL